MARKMTAAQWQSQMKKWGVKAEYLPGWSTRGRPDSTAGGPFVPVGIMIHHTGSDSQSQSYIDWLFKQGRPAEGIPAPLANVMTMMDGTLVVGSAGKANHAGPGSQAILTKVKNQTVSLSKEEKPGPNGPNGNPLFYGDEVAFDGGQSMTNPQYATVIRWCAAICDFYDWSSRVIIGHGEWTRAKWDPGMCDMAQLRKDVAKLLKAGPPSSIKKPAKPSKPVNTTKPKPVAPPVVVPPLLFKEKAYTWNVNGKLATTMPRRAKTIGEEVETSNASIVMMQECYVVVRGLVKKQLPKHLHFVGAYMGKAMWIDPRIWSFEKETVKKFSLGNGKNGMSVLLKHRATGEEVVASTSHLVVGSKRGADRIAEMKRWCELMEKFYGKTPKILGADYNDERIKSGGPRREAINHHGYHAPESDVRVENIMHGEFDTYNGYAKTPPKDGKHIDGFLITQELFATRVRIDNHPYPQGSDHYGVEVAFGVTA